MAISLSQNLFLEAGSALKQNSASKSQKNSNSAEDLLSTGRDFENQNIAANSEKVSINEKSADFDEILVKKIAAKKMFNPEEQIPNQDENLAQNDENTKSEDLPNILTAQNIILDTNVENSIQQQTDENQKLLRAVEDYVEVPAAKTDNPVISQEIDDINVEESTNLTVDQNEQIGQEEINKIPAQAVEAEDIEVLSQQEIVENINIDSQVAQTATENQINIPQINQNQKIEEAEELKIDEINPQAAASDEITNNEKTQQTSKPSETVLVEDKVPTVQTSDLKNRVSEETKDQETEKVTNSANDYETSIIEGNDNQNAKIGIKHSDDKNILPKQQIAEEQINVDQSPSQAKNQDTQADNSLFNNIPSLISSPDQNSVSHQTHNADSTASVGVQIQDSIQSTLSADNKEIVIQLNPPELGKVEIKFTEENNTLTGILSVNKPTTKHEIQQTLPEVIQNLQESGINIKKIEVVLSGNQEQQTMKDQSSMSGHNWAGQQNQANPDSHRNGNVYNQWTFSSGSFVQSYEQSGQYSETYVNMLA